MNVVWTLGHWKLSDQWDCLLRLRFTSLSALAVVGVVAAALVFLVDCRRREGALAGRSRPAFFALSVLSLSVLCLADDTITFYFAWFGLVLSSIVLSPRDSESDGVTLSAWRWAPGLVSQVALLVAVVLLQGMWHTTDWSEMRQRASEFSEFSRLRVTLSLMACVLAAWLPFFFKPAPRDSLWTVFQFWCRNAIAPVGALVLLSRTSFLGLLQPSAATTFSYLLFACAAAKSVLPISRPVHPLSLTAFGVAVGAVFCGFCLAIPLANPWPMRWGLAAIIGVAAAALRLGAAAWKGNAPEDPPTIAGIEAANAAARSWRRIDESFWNALWQVPVRLAHAVGGAFVYWQGTSAQYMLVVILMGTLLLFWAALKTQVILVSKVFLEVALITPLLAAVVCVSVSAALANWIARLLSLVPLVITFWFWTQTDPATILPVPLTEGVWLPGVPVDFSLAVTGLALPFWVLGQSVACMAIWQESKTRSWACAPLLLFAQFSLTVVFASQDLLLFGAAVQAFWLSIVFSSQMEENGPATPALPYVLGAGTLFLISASILGGLHQEQFQTFSTRIPALRELNLSTQSVWGEFTLAEILFAMMAVATALLAPLPPAHGWLQALLRGKSRAPAVLAVGLAPALAVFTFLQWIVPVLPQAYSTASAWLLVATAGASLYAAGLALAADDVFEWLTGAALFQTAFALVGVHLGNAESATGSALHAVVWPALGVGLVCLFGWLETAFGSRRPEDIGSLTSHSPRVALVLAVLGLAAIAAPASGLFPSVVLTFSGLFQLHPLLGIVVAVAWALWVCSTLRLGRNFFFGACLHQGIRSVPDLRWRRVAAAALLAVLSLWVGVRPDLLKSKTDPALKSYWKAPLKAQRATALGGHS